jgi:hypothetical protein
MPRVPRHVIQASRGCNGPAIPGSDNGTAPRRCLMKIAIVTETYPPEVNGVALTVHSLVSQMAADGHDLLLVRPRQPGVSAMPLARPISELLVAGAALPKYPGM